MDIGSILIYLAGIVWGIELIPQIRKTYKTKNVDGISLQFFVMCTFAYILYAFGNYFQQNWAVLISHIPSIIMNLIMVFLIIKYKSGGK
jgi:uncharacterized protein with PQ loop repeat